MTERSEVEKTIMGVQAKEAQLMREEVEFKREREEGAVLVGRDILSYEEYEVETADVFSEERALQEERRRKLEKMKIRLEEQGLSSSEEVLKEHTEVRERDAFLTREVEDLVRSAESLRALIAELTQTLQIRFADGITKINAAFDEFFKLMFGGGGAELTLVKEQKRRYVSAEEGEESGEEEEEVEEGIEIGVHLPQKRIKGLHMLSGGERALTSIALIFAMSQVNPPPFLILDETDAALDEANSRRYGDMIESLAKHSQLILITHNRETMSRAGVLYGVTMGADGASKLLSVRFEEALAVAK
jgi:chromosome segregation protein